MTDKKFFKETEERKNIKSSEIIELVQAIENSKQKLADAEFKVQYLPKIINNLEKRLFEIIQKEGA